MTGPSEDLATFAQQLQQEIFAQAESDDGDQFREEVFTQRMIELLEDFGELDDATPCQYQRRGIKVDGYSVGPDEQTLDLIVAYCEWAIPPATVNRSTLMQLARQARGFLSECLAGSYQKMEPATPAFDLALRIYELRSDLSKIRIFIITDGVCKDAIIPDDQIKTISVTHNVWDIERVFRCASSGRQREPIAVDFGEFGGAVPCLQAEDQAGTYTSYLAIIQGAALASIYEKWGTRLLEKNVRAFLQARGKVNQGIRECLLKEPRMFVTYNNGISVTAENAETVRMEDGGIGLSRIVDFQIVNGGQTTASIFHARRKDKAELVDVKVQMKLTVVKKGEAIDEIVSRISRFANTQNKINLADFAANDPFHREVEALSRTVWAPDPAGGKRQSHWFYERARGQYMDERGRAGAAAQIRVFDSVNPRGQLFTKTDLAKFENTWNQLPHTVSRGAQKNFSEFSAQVRERGGYRADQQYFESLVAKAIMFRQAEKIVGREAFGGYRANIVTYTLALISNMSAQRVDLHRIWATQELSPSFKEEVQRLSGSVHSHIIKPPGGGNVTEWCKKEECWTALQTHGLKLSKLFESELLPVGAAVSRPKTGVLGEDRIDTENLDRAKAIGAIAWLELSSWGRVTNNLASWQRGIVFAVGKRIQQGQRPSPKQVKQAMIAYEEAVRRGFKPGVES